MSLIIPIILSALLIYIIYRVTLKIKPEIFMNKDSSISKIVSQMKTLKFYKPTPWLINGHFHTIWGMRFRGKANYKPFREDIDFEDNGQVTIEHMNKGYRVIICSCRACNGSKLKTKRICDSSNYQDTHVIID